MRTLLTLIAIIAGTFGMNAQKATVTATNYDISDNLDLQAVAQLFGESKDLKDFEYKLNDPSLQISNLDLNRDYQVDYLRVVETTQDYFNLIVIQAVLGQDMFQDVATIEIERKKANRQVSIQIVGNSFIYGHNYIFEPIYVTSPIIYNYFWRPNYVVYHSPYYWGYYPKVYRAWRPMPVFRYHNHIHHYVNVHHIHWNYTPNRRNTTIVNVYNTSHRRGNAYESSQPNRGFEARNQNTQNRYELSSRRSNQATTNNSRLVEGTGITRERVNNNSTVNTTRNNNMTRESRNINQATSNNTRITSNASKDSKMNTSSRASHPTESIKTNRTVNNSSNRISSPVTTARQTPQRTVQGNSNQKVSSERLQTRNTQTQNNNRSSRSLSSGNERNSNNNRTAQGRG